MAIVNKDGESLRMRKILAGTAALAALALLPACAAVPAMDTAGPGDIPISGSRVFPESITSDAAGNLYNSSTGGTIYRTLAGSRTAEPWIEPDAENGLTSLFGLMADDGRELLWACNNPNIFAGETGQSSLLAFGLADGLRKGRYDFPSGAPAACNDIAVAADGTVWVTETSGGRIFVVRPDAEELALFAEGEELVGIDGIAFAEDGALYINNVRQNLFQRVNRAADGSYAGLTNLTVPVTLGGPDGLRPLGGNRFIQGEGQSGRVAVLEVSGDTAAMADVATGLNGPVGVTVVGDTAYVVEGKIGYLFDPALRVQDPDPFAIRAFALPEGP
jgi:sugar lactone lactonase YvrE